MLEFKMPLRQFGVPAVLVLMLIAAPVVHAEVAQEGTFEATWSLEGTRESIEIQGEKLAAYVLKGDVKVRRSDGLSSEFESTCTGISDEKTSGSALCEWTDSEGEAIFLQFTGKIVGPMGTVRESEGEIVGGTGRYKGLEGWISTDWLFWESALEEGKVTGRDTDTKGGWSRP